MRALNNTKTEFVQNFLFVLVRFSLSIFFKASYTPNIELWYMVSDLFTMDSVRQDMWVGKDDDL